LTYKQILDKKSAKIRRPLSQRAKIGANRQDFWIKNVTHQQARAALASVSWSGEKEGNGFDSSIV
jgi:hypothetical protein